MPNTKTVRVPHLGGIEAAYQMPRPYDSSKPTLVLINSFTASSELYRSQYADEKLNAVANLLAIELLGHGQTRTKAENWTYWDTAVMNLQVLEALGVKGKVFVLGTSQGGWVTVRMALLAPEKISGIIPVGTSMDTESERTRALGCWDAPTGLTPVIDGWTTNDETTDFEPSEDYCNFLIDTGLGTECAKETRDFWIKEVKANYRGDAGRRRARMAAINLRDRDGLHARLFDVRCPVLWLHGTADVVYSAKNANEEIKKFVNSPDSRLEIVQGGQHFLSASNPEEVGEALIKFIEKYSAGSASATSRL